MTFCDILNYNLDIHLFIIYFYLYCQFNWSCLFVCFFMLFITFNFFWRGSVYKNAPLLSYCTYHFSCIPNPNWIKHVSSYSFSQLNISKKYSKNITLFLRNIINPNICFEIITEWTSSNPTRVLFIEWT